MRWGMAAIALALGCRGFDGTPPSLEVRGPVGPVQRMAEFTIKVHDAETAVRRLVVTIDDQRAEVLDIPEGPSPHEFGWVLGASSLGQGVHEVAFVAHDDAVVGNTTVKVVRIEVDRQPPKLELHPPTLEAGQGRTAVVWVRAKNEPLAEAFVRFGDDREPMFAVDGAFRALRGIPIRAATGPLKFVVTAEDRAGNGARIEGAIRIESTAFEEGGVVPMTRKQKAARSDTKALRTMRRERDSTYGLRTLEQRWTKAFQWPVIDGKVSSSFGKFRTYGDGRRDHHTGVDIVKAPGVDILAPAPGRVVLAKPQAVFGNVVILDHGQGVTSSYNHLATIDVEEGTQIQAGAKLATMGSTGQSTGPHLHWSMVVGGEAVDPGEWTRRAFTASPFRDDD